MKGQIRRLSINKGSFSNGFDPSLFQGGMDSLMRTDSSFMGIIPEKSPKRTGQRRESNFQH